MTQSESNSKRLDGKIAVTGGSSGSLLVAFTEIGSLRKNFTGRELRLTSGSKDLIKRVCSIISCNYKCV
jgi:hypothetical protein